MTNFACQTKRNAFSLFLVLILLLACILGCKTTAPAPSWTKTKVLAQNEDHPSKIIADGSFVYFVNGAGTIAAKNEGTNNIKRISLKNGSVSVLVKGGEHFPSDALAVDDQFLYWSDGGTILRVRKDGGDSFDNEPGGGMIGTVALRKVSKNGGEPMILDHGRAGWVKSIAVDKTQIYFADIANVYALTK